MDSDSIYVGDDPEIPGLMEEVLRLSKIEYTGRKPNILKAIEVFGC